MPDGGILAPGRNERVALRRDRDLLGRANSPLRKKLEELYETILKGWRDQGKRSDHQDDWWNCYNCVLDENQFYTGNAELYVPIVRDAIHARATRFVNQLFPNSGRYVEVVSHDGKQPSDIIAILDHYIREKKLKTRVARPLSINGDIEGQYNLYIDWSEVGRWVVSRTLRPPLIAGPAGEEVEDQDGEPYPDIEMEQLVESGPGFEVLHDSDVLVLPQGADSVEEALEKGGCAVICRRWSKADVERMADEGAIRDEEEKFLLDLIEAGPQVQKSEVPDQEKLLAEAVGIRAKGGPITAWEVWHKLPLDEKGYAKDGERRLCRIWFGPERRPLGAQRNPYWNDLCPLLSEPVVKIAGRFKGQSPVEPIAPLQWAANDAANEGEDSAHYAAMPMMRVSPQVSQPIVLNVGAILRADQGEVDMVAFPDLTQRQLTRIGAYTQAIFQSLGVNPAMLPQQTGRVGAKRNQAEVAMEQQVDLLTTAEAVTTLEEGIFTPLCGFIVDLDHQYRDRALTVRKFGVMGKRAEMEEIAPLQQGHRYFFKWLGAEAARNAAMLQSQVGAINVLRTMKPDLMAEGYRLRLGPLIENLSMALFGAATGAQVIEDMRHQSSLDPGLENELMMDGYDLPAMPLDQDQEHIRAHQRIAQMTGDPEGHFRLHIQAHMAQMSQKMAAQAQMAMRQMLQPGGAPGGSPGGMPGRPGPRPGAVPAGPRAVAQQPPGAIRPDNMPAAGALTMPRRM
jgi:hypothetical protein